MMHIITNDDFDFADLLSCLQDSVLVGHYWQDGKIQVVRANKRLMMVSSYRKPKKIAIKPARNLGEAEDLAMRFLMHQGEDGLEVDYAKEFNPL